MKVILKMGKKMEMVLCELKIKLLKPNFSKIDLLVKELFKI